MLLGSDRAKIFFSAPKIFLDGLTYARSIWFLHVFLARYSHKYISALLTAVHTNTNYNGQ